MIRRIYWNIHRGGWSILNPKTGLVENKGKFTSYILLQDVSFKVYEHRRQQVIANKVKNVHAYACGEIVGREPTLLDMLFDTVPVSYNPYKAAHFYRKDNGEPVTACRFLLMTTAKMGDKRIPVLLAEL